MNQDNDTVELKLDFEPPPVMSSACWQEMEYHTLKLITETCRVPLHYFYERKNGVPLTEEKYIKVNLRNWISRTYIRWLRWRGWIQVRVTLTNPNAWIVDKDAVTLWFVR